LTSLSTLMTSTANVGAKSILTSNEDCLARLEHFRQPDLNPATRTIAALFASGRS
jgi:hypothetical protein